MGARSFRRLLGTTLVACASLMGCVDGTSVSGPDAGFMVPVAFAPTFIASVTDVPPEPITHVRLEAVERSTNQIVGAVTHEVNPDDERWLLEISVEVPAYTELDVQVLVVLLSGEAGIGVAEWSGRSGALLLSAATPDRNVQTLPVYRGPPANLEVTGLRASVAGELLDGDAVPLVLSVDGPVEGARVFLRSLDPGVVAVDGERIVGMGVGTGRVVAEAGPVADTLVVSVAPWPLPPREEIEAAGPSISDSGTRLLEGLANAEGAAAIAAGMSALQEALASGSGGDILRAIDDARGAVNIYNGGDWGPDGPDLSLVLHSLDVLELTLRSTRDSN